MDRFQAMEIFTLVVETGGFKRAAEALRLLPSTVTKTIQDLEAHLGTRLLHRTTRAIRVTDAGMRYYRSCKEILRDVQAAEETAAGDNGVIRGVVRIGTTPSLARRILIPQLPQFATRYPEVRIELHLSDDLVDLVQQGIDCVIRAGEPVASRMIIRRIATFVWYICGAPDYLTKNGAPGSLEDLRRHVAVGYANRGTGRPTNWEFRDGEEITSVSMNSYVTVNDTDAYVAAAVAGLGLIRIASYVAQESLAEGRLVRLLPHLESPPVPLSLLYASSRHVSSASRAFMDWCIDIIGAEAKRW